MLLFFKLTIRNTPYVRLALYTNPVKNGLCKRNRNSSLPHTGV